MVEHNRGKRYLVGCVSGQLLYSGERGQTRDSYTLGGADALGQLGLYDDMSFCLGKNIKSTLFICIYWVTGARGGNFIR